MLAYTSIDNESVMILHETVQNMLEWVIFGVVTSHTNRTTRRWIIENKKDLFLPEYENSSPQYQNRVNAGS